MNNNTICLWYDHDAEEAARFYAQTFPDSTANAVFRAPSDFAGDKAMSWRSISTSAAYPASDSTAAMPQAQLGG